MKEREKGREGERENVCIMFMCMESVGIALFIRK